MAEEAFVVVSFLKNEEKYIVEHYAWYKLLGFNHHYYVFNNCTDNSESTLNTIASNDPSVRVVHNNVRAGGIPQLSGAKLIFKELQKHFMGGYILVVDMDEFLLLKKHQSIKELISDYAYPDAMSFNWRIFGSNGLSEYTPDLVTNRFTRCSLPEFAGNEQMKTIWRMTQDITGFGAHRPRYKNNTVFNNLKWIVPSTDGGHPVQHDFMTGTTPKLDRSAMVDIAQINHYAVKSLEEYVIRQQRGRGMAKATGKTRHTHSYFLANDRNDVLEELTLNRKTELSALTSKINQLLSESVIEQVPEKELATVEPMAMQPSFDTEGLQLFCREIAMSRLYLEYGAGGSSFFAMKCGVPRIISVDTSADWLDKVKTAIEGNNVDYIPVHIDLGPLKKWGWPKESSHELHWKDYCCRVWELLGEKNWQPDLILVDGRFRCASFLASWIFSAEGTVILFDDYSNRKKYHVVEKIAGVPELYGRIARFVRPAEIDFLSATALLLRYINVPD